MAAKKKSSVKASAQPVPLVNPDAALEIEKVTSPEVPTVDKNAPLKIDEVEEKEENEPQDKLNKRLFVFGGFALGIIITLTVVLLAFFLMQSSGKDEAKKTAEVISTPTVAPKQVLVRSEWSFEVLNGSGVAGAAKKVADQLIALGYQVVETGNADKQTYKGNGLFVSQEMEGKLDLMVADLKDTIEIATVAGVLKDSTASARIIVGK
jgi:hypothetical protein